MSPVELESPETGASSSSTPPTPNSGSDDAGRSNSLPLEAPGTSPAPSWFPNNQSAPGTALPAQEQATTSERSQLDTTTPPKWLGQDQVTPTPKPVTPPQNELPSISDPARRTTLNQERGLTPDLENQEPYFPYSQGNLTAPTEAAPPPASSPASPAPSGPAENPANQQRFDGIHLPFSRKKKQTSPDSEEVTDTSSSNPEPPPEPEEDTNNQSVLGRLGKRFKGKAVKNLGRQIITKVTARLAVMAAAPGALPILGVAVGVLIGIVVAFAVGSVIGRALGIFGDNTNPDAAIGKGQISNSANPDGYYLKNMVPQFPIPNAGSLAMDTTAGGMVIENESVLTADGKVCWSSDTSRCTSFGHDSKGKYDLQTRRQESFTPDEVKYYLNMRWPYVHDVDWPTGRHPKRGAPTGYPRMQFYGGRRVIVWNKTKNKAAVGVIAEWGPEPASGVCTNNWADNNSGNPRSGSNPNACKEEGDAWNNPSRMGLNGDFHVPDNYTGWAIGASPALAQLVDANNHDVLIVGFAKDQNLAPGTVFNPEQEDLIYQDRSLATAPINGNILPVPAVGQGGPGYCNRTSKLAVALYYLSNKGTAVPPLNQLPEQVAGALALPDSNDGSNIVYKSTANNDSCLLYSYLNLIGRGVPNDWIDFSAKSVEDMRTPIINSIQGGDPVVLYTFGTIYKPVTINGQQWGHVVVIVGYDASTGEFLINNSFYSQGKAGVMVGIRGSDVHKPAFTPEYLYQTRGDSVYSRSMTIRKKYLK